MVAIPQTMGTQTVDRGGKERKSLSKSTAFRRKDAVFLRKDAVSFRQDAAAFRQDAASLRQNVDSFRRNGASFRQDAVSLRKDAASFRGIAEVHTAFSAVAVFLIRARWCCQPLRRVEAMIGMPIPDEPAEPSPARPNKLRN